MLDRGDAAGETVIGPAPSPPGANFPERSRVTPFTTPRGAWPGGSVGGGSTGKVWPFLQRQILRPVAFNTA